LVVRQDKLLNMSTNAVTVTRLIDAVNAGDAGLVRLLLQARPELIGMDTAGNNEQRALHYAVQRRDAAMVRLLMEAGADAHQGVWPHRDATTAYTIASDREYVDIVSVIEEEERRRREEMSCPNATVSPVQEQINEAISEGANVAAIRLLEADKSLIQACDRDGSSPLHIAAEVANAEMVSWLLERRADARKEDAGGLTPLDRAALAADSDNDHAKSFPAIAKLMLEQRAPLTIRAAVALADSARVRELVAADPSVLKQITWRSGGLLTLAVNHGHLEMVGLLLDLGADVDERTLLHELDEPTVSWGGPLWHAARAGQYDIAKLLLDRGADPNANVYASGWPLRNAWNHPDGSLKRLLLERGAKPQPYMVSESHDVKEAQALLAADNGEELAKELAWSAADSGCAAIVEMALPHLNWVATDARWHWILIQPVRGIGGDAARREGFFKCMEILLRRIDPNISSNLGQTVLHFTAASHADITGAERARFAALFLDRGARLNIRDLLLKSTALGWACRWGRAELVELLIAHGAAIDEPEAEPWATPAAWAEKRKHAEVLAILKRSAGR
jgi:ankyrin repeat protein